LNGTSREKKGRPALRTYLVWIRQYLKELG